MVKNNNQSLLQQIDKTISEAGAVVLRVKPLLAMPASYIGVLGWILVVPLVIQFPANAPNESADDSLSPELQPWTWETCMELRAHGLVSAQPQALWPFGE